MKFYKLYILVLFFILSFSTVSLAENTDVMSTSENDYKEKRINFFYLLGTAGYQGETDKYGLYTYKSSRSRSVIEIPNTNHHGFAINVVGGWQARKYFAMELAFGYSESISRSVGIKYALLFQPYLKLDNSWSIMPKIGLGISGDGVVGIANKDYSLEDSTISELGNFKVVLYGVIGLMANYNKFIFGLSYENSLFGMTSEFRVLAHAGIKF